MGLACIGSGEGGCEHAARLDCNPLPSLVLFVQFLTESENDAGTIAIGESAADACECASNLISRGLCGELLCE